MAAGCRCCSPRCAMVVMWTWVRGTELLTQKVRGDSIPIPDLIRMLEKSKPIRVAGTAIFLTNSPEIAPSALMHNLKHNKVLHERVWLLSVIDRRYASRSRQQDAIEIEKLSEDFTRVILHYGYMESPRVPAALASLRKAGLEIRYYDDVVFPRPADDQARPQFRHAFVAGPAFYRPVAASGECDRLLLDTVGPRRRAWRPGDGLIFARGRGANALRSFRHAHAPSI